MNIEAKGYTIHLDLDELWDLAFSVNQSLKYSLQTHWVNHQTDWERMEAKKLELLKAMFNALGRLDVYEQIFEEAELIFKDFNEKQELN